MYYIMYYIICIYIKLRIKINDYFLLSIVRKKYQQSTTKTFTSHH